MSRRAFVKKKKEKRMKKENEATQYITHGGVGRGEFAYGVVTL